MGKAYKDMTKEELESEMDKNDVDEIKKAALRELYYVKVKG